MLHIKKNPFSNIISNEMIYIRNPKILKLDKIKIILLSLYAIYKSHFFGINLIEHYFA